MIQEWSSIPVGNNKFLEALFYLGVILDNRSDNTKALSRYIQETGWWLGGLRIILEKNTLNLSS